MADGEIDITRGDAHQPDATIDTDNDTINAVLWEGRSLTDAQRSGRLTIGGDKTAVKRFIRLFPMPEPTAAIRPA